jgi:hypothetical protein
MSDWVNPAIVAGAALLSSALTGAITLRASRRSDLAAALQAYGYAADRLRLEIGQMAPPPGRIGVALQSGVARARSLDWTLGQISRHTLARPALHVLDTYTAAFNRLILVAPVRVLDAMRPLNDLLGRLDERGDAWNSEWSVAREALGLAARLALASPATRLRYRARILSQRVTSRRRGRQGTAPSAS